MSNFTVTFLVNCLVFTLFPYCPLSAQVRNDDIENRIELLLGAPYKSKTDGCTVQWKCVDERLTGKCIEYHNDQWFSFNSEVYRQLYINVSNQRCRDMRGVQIVVLKGQPCDPRTYDILTCVSLANQNDVYVTLKALQENEEYLVNVDGYLHDYCTFQIEVSENAKGLPIAPSQAMDTNSSQHDNLIRIEWNLEDSLKNVIAGFRIFLSRDEAAKSTLYAEIPLEVNAHGDFRKTYWFEDSILPKSTYRYTLASSDLEGKLDWIETFMFRYNSARKSIKAVRYIQVPLHGIKHKENYTIAVYDQQSGELLERQSRLHHKKEPEYMIYKTASAIQAYVDSVRIEVTNHDSGKVHEYIFDLWQQ
jgi:hypothetical protein